MKKIKVVFSNKALNKALLVVGLAIIVGFAILAIAMSPQSIVMILE